jgi:hypothetical protein
MLTKPDLNGLDDMMVPDCNTFTENNKSDPGGRPDL